MDLFPKFIVVIDDTDGYCLIYSKCTYHKELVGENQKPVGGGWFTYDRETNTFILHGESHDFGKASFEDIEKCFADNGGGVYSNRYMISDKTDQHNFFYRNEVGELFPLKTMVEQ